MSDFVIPFDSLSRPNLPKPEPLVIRAGDTLTWARSLDNFDSAAGWVLSYVFVGLNTLYTVSGAMITQDNGNFSVKVPATSTATWLAGQYRWQAYATSAAGDRFTIDEGVAEVLPNLQVAVNGMDDREQDEVILDNIKAMIAGKATADVQSYEISGRRLDKYSWGDLMKMRSVFEQRVRKLRLARGEKVPSRAIGVIFRNGY